MVLLEGLITFAQKILNNQRFITVFLTICAQAHLIAKYAINVFI